MTVLVVGGSGATGRLLVSQLLERGHDVRMVVRAKSRLPEPIQKSANVHITEASLLELTDAELGRLVDGVDAIASCLGHNLSFKGLFGPPYRLVTDAARRLCRATDANNPEHPVKYVLMNTTGNRNRDLNEPVSFAQSCVIWLLRLLLPPHADNENAADYLRTEIAQGHDTIEWVAVRPDGLIDEDAVSEVEIHPSPVRSAIFDAGQTSRINVARFMADLIDHPQLWATWKGRMPVIYNSASMKDRAG